MSAPVTATVQTENPIFPNPKTTINYPYFSGEETQEGDTSSEDRSRSRSGSGGVLKQKHTGVIVEEQEADDDRGEKGTHLVVVDPAGDEHTKDCQNSAVVPQELQSQVVIEEADKISFNIQKTEPNSPHVNEGDGSSVVACASIECAQLRGEAFLGCSSSDTALREHFLQNENGGEHLCCENSFHNHQSPPMSPNCISSDGRF